MTRQRVFVGAAAMLVVAFAFAYATTGHAIAPKASAAAVDYYLKIDGIPGESTAKAHPNEIEVNSWSWGIQSPRDVATGQATGKRQYQPLIIRKEVDKATPLLFRACADGKTIKQMVLTGSKGGESPFDYLVYTFSNLQCTGDKQSGELGDLAKEEVTLNYSKVQIDYKQQSADGGVDVSPVTGVFDATQ